MLGAVLDDAASMLRRLPGVIKVEQPLPRMADYFLALQALGTEYATGYVDAVEDTMRVVADTDPFVHTLLAWLDDEGERRSTPRGVGAGRQAPPRGLVEHPRSLVAT